MAFRFSRALATLALWLVAVCFSPLSRAVTFTSNVTISQGDTTYDGQDVIVDDATATFNGAHSFTSLTLMNGAMLTHSPCTATETYKLEVNVAGDGHGECRQPDHVSGRGYVARRTTGNTMVGGLVDWRASFALIRRESAASCKA